MSRETDTEPVGTLDEAALQRGAAVVRKVNEADGPLHLDADEAATLKAILLGFQKQTQIDALIEALDRADECRSASAGDAVCHRCWDDVVLALEAVRQVYKPEAVTKIEIF